MKHISLALMSCCLAASAFAGLDQGSKPVQTLKFEQLKEACLHPERFQNQVAPANIEVSCRDIQYKWIPDSSGQFPLETSRLVTTSVNSDKYRTESVAGSVDTPMQSQACPRFKQIAEVLETVRAASCEELVAFDGNATEYCAASLDSMRQANPGSINVQETGEHIDLCGGSKGHK